MPSNYTLSSDSSYVGAILPDSGVHPLTLALDYQKINDQKKLREQQLQKEKDAQKAAMQKHFGSFFDAQKYHTGTDIDKLINDQIATGAEDINKFIQQNPYADDTDIRMLVNDKINPVVKLNTLGKAVAKYIDTTTESFKNEKGINVGAVKAYAMHDALYKNEGGKWVLKSPEEIDEGLQTTNYVTKAIKKNAKNVLFGDGGFRDDLNSFKTTILGDINQTDHAGINRKSEWNAELYPYQELQKDKRGNVVGVKLKTETAKFGDKEIPVIPEDIYKLFQSKAGNVAYISTLVDQETKGKIDHDSPEYDILARHLLINELENKGAKKFVTKDLQNEDAWRGKMDAGVTNINVGKGTGTEATTINDIYGTIDSAVRDANSRGKKYKAVNSLPLDAQTLLIDFAQKATGGKEVGEGEDKKKEPITQADILVGKEAGNLVVYTNKGKRIGVISFVGTNLSKQADVKGKREVVKQGEKKEKPAKTSSILKGNVR